MSQITLEEKNMAAIGFNIFRKFDDEVKIVARYHEGRPVECRQEYRIIQASGKAFFLAPIGAQVQTSQPSRKWA